MKLNERAAATMKLVGGRLCLDFVNTVGGRNMASASAKNQNRQYEIRADKLQD